MTDISKLIDKAKQLEKNMKESQKKIKEIKAEGVSGGDKVKITLNGEGDLTNIYIAPEILLRSYTKKCDIWSLGVIFFTLLTGHFPFDHPVD